jgi:hypothetical protein
MSGWSRTTKPSADTTKDAADIYGVDRNEIAVTAGPAQVGWVHRREVGSRVLFETLVAMKTPPTEDNADDTVFPDTIITIVTQPESIAVDSGDPATFTVVATASPTATLTYQWQVSTNGGTSYSNLTNAGVYSTVTTDILNISDATGLDTYQYLCVIAGTNTGATATSDAAILTVNL